MRPPPRRRTGIVGDGGWASHESNSTRAAPNFPGARVPLREALRARVDSRGGRVNYLPPRVGGGTRGGDIPLRQAQGLEPVETAVAVPDRAERQTSYEWTSGPPPFPRMVRLRRRWTTALRLRSGHPRQECRRSLGTHAPCSRHTEDDSQEAIEWADVHDVGEGNAFVVWANTYRRG